MSVHAHPPELRQLCGEAAALFEALPGQGMDERGVSLGKLRELLGRVDETVKDLDLRDPEFPREQGWLVDASSALQSIELDRGGWNVTRFASRAAADLRRVADGSD